MGAPWQSATVAFPTIVQVLTINLLTDGLPALALTRDALAPETMRRPPDGGHAILTPGAAEMLALVAVAASICLPAGNDIFGTVPLPIGQAATVAALSVGPLTALISNDAAAAAPRAIAHDEGPTWDTAV